MEPVTKEDREKELRHLLSEMEAHPERDWTKARERAKILQQMLHTPEQPA